MESYTEELNIFEDNRWCFIIVSVKCLGHGALLGGGKDTEGEGPEKRYIPTVLCLALPAEFRK